MKVIKINHHYPQALESKNASLKVELSKTLSAKNSEIDQLSKKLE